MANTEQYIQAKARPILVPLLHKLVQERPTDVRAFMLDHLNKELALLRNTPDSLDLPPNETITVCIPQNLILPADNQPLSPFDRTNLGRSVPMVWYFNETINVRKMLLSLEQALAAYPCLAGRYTGGSEPGAGDDTGLLS